MKRAKKSKPPSAPVINRLLKLFLGLCLAAAVLGVGYALSKTTHGEWLSGIFSIGENGSGEPMEEDYLPVDREALRRIDYSQIAGPRIAIIIDDIGDNIKVTDELLAIDGALTFSVLPDRLHSVESARHIRAADRELMLHLPMEPFGRKESPGADALKISMNKRHIKKLLKKNLNALPGIMGVNNHMGSKFTADGKKMTIVLDIIKRRGLFFIDSHTTRKSAAYRLAKRKGMVTYENDIFLDGTNTEEYVRKQLKRLIEMAKLKGRAMAICHPRSATIAVFKIEIPLIGERGVTLVPASVLAEGS